MSLRIQFYVLCGFFSFIDAFSANDQTSTIPDQVSIEDQAIDRLNELKANMNKAADLLSAHQEKLKARKESAVKKKTSVPQKPSQNNESQSDDQPTIAPYTDGNVEELAIKELTDLKANLNKAATLMKEHQEKLKARKKGTVKKYVIIPHGKKTFEIHSNVIDQEYMAFMKTVYPHYEKYSKMWEKSLTEDPNSYFKKKYGEKLKKNAYFAPGTYGITSLMIKPWYEQVSPAAKMRNKHGQGWKIHISALPQSAKKIAEIILPILQRNSEGEEFVAHKICATIPFLRTVLGEMNVLGEESQAGKFLVIYPDNAEHTYQVVKAIDSALLKSMEKGILNESDFFPLVGDAQIGYSGGVYIRYGQFFTETVQVTKHGQFISRERKPGVKKVNPLDQSIYRIDPPEDPLQTDIVSDDRFYPWPDFINKENKFWKTAESPFHELPLRWTSYYNSTHIINSWEDRPNSWHDLATSSKEIEEVGLLNRSSSHLKLLPPEKP